MVRLVTITPGTEGLILYCARVSSDQSNEGVGLIRYLIRKGHWSPFEMAHAVFEIKTSRAIAAQILRHRSFAFQEFSQRYSKPEGTVKYRARRQADKNRQSSVDDLSEEDIEWFYDAQDEIESYSFSMYEQAVQAGIARESARILLPLGTSTKLYMAGSLRSWIHYCNLRCQDDVQLEHRQIALAIREALSDELPTIAEALEWR